MIIANEFGTIPIDHELVHAGREHSAQVRTLFWGYGASASSVFRPVLLVPVSIPARSGLSSVAVALRREIPMAAIRGFDAISMPRRRECGSKPAV